ncbi:hypothetical protein [Haloarcula sp. JP-L23]|uniref:hypothetical protein n=1 Tax=Haloarcula sp. JP-L23 TaxID=2716717 RepID=UPI00140F24A9|nr:hypothetical protein G9465_19890 [Haloarcula sp. JP-L23]
MTTDYDAVGVVVLRVSVMSRAESPNRPVVRAAPAWSVARSLASESTLSDRSVARPRFVTAERVSARELVSTESLT